MSEPISVDAKHDSISIRVKSGDGREREFYCEYVQDDEVLGTVAIATIFDGADHAIISLRAAEALKLGEWLMQVVRASGAA